MYKKFDEPVSLIEENCNYIIVYLNKIPKAFKKEILNGRFILYDGNSKCFLCCDDMYFYLLDWRGS
jgi:hypothetical protein